MCSRDVDRSISACPFLRKVAETEGESFARRLAVNPFRPAAAPNAGPIFVEDDSSSFASTLSLFHGSGGVLPLPTVMGSAASDAGRASTDAASCGGSVEHVTSGTGCEALASLPFAAISLSGGFWSNGGPFGRRREERPSHGRDAGGGRSGPNGKGSHATGRGSLGGLPSLSSASSSASSRSSLRGRGPRGPPSGGAERCPLRRVFGGLLPLTPGGELRCPRAVTKLRGFVARLQPVRALRPQSAPVRAVGIMALAALANLPAGVARAHTTKFSPAWFLAVHTPVPFTAALRKAVVMPPAAMLLTLAASIVGQAAGARLEMARMRRAGRAPARDAVVAHRLAHNADADATDAMLCDARCGRYAPALANLSRVLLPAAPVTLPTCA